MPILLLNSTSAQVMNQIAEGHTAIYKTCKRHFSGTILHISGSSVMIARHGIWQNVEEHESIPLSSIIEVLPYE